MSENEEKNSQGVGHILEFNCCQLQLFGQERQMIDVKAITTTKILCLLTKTTSCQPAISQTLH